MPHNTIPTTSTQARSVAEKIDYLLSKGWSLHVLATHAELDYRVLKKIMFADGNVQARKVETVTGVVDDLILTEATPRTMQADGSPEKIARDRDMLFRWFKSRGRVLPGQTLTDLIGYGRQAA